MEQTGPTSFVFYYKGARLATVSRPGHYDPGPRIQDLDEYGIDIQMISVTTPSAELIPAKEGVPWAKRMNDYLASVCDEYKGRFYAYATLPYQDVKASLKELERAYKELGVRGITMFSNLAGKPIYAPQFLPIYEAAEAFDLPIFIHPAPPITTDALKRVEMPLPLYGFVLDTTMAVTGLIFKGVFDRFPNLKIVHSHLGGVFPYLVGRINDSFRSYAQDYGITLDDLPTEYYRRNVWVDAISFHLPAMKCALEYLGAEHIMVGTDYAHPIGGPEKVMGFVKGLDLSPEDYEKIAWRNAAKLFRLDL
jgi:aminocarboxymuconate-semialdehyde decarboxylase